VLKASFTIIPSCRLVVWLFRLHGLIVWNALPDELRDSACDAGSFKQFIKQPCLAFIIATMALEVILNVTFVEARIYVLLAYESVVSLVNANFSR